MIRTAPVSSALLDAARRERARILALAGLLAEIDEIEPDVGDDVIIEAIHLFRDVAGAASAGSVLLDQLLHLQPDIPFSPDHPERTRHEHPIA